ncbi:hypothetical protein TNIN_107171 [Trichonephila inaurata madagascariensis]|uniref:Uncharacterized protein n=1 Tax=Trichonephila inaurata madagascariensis TaxID=2747483 RepID=A0A8X6WYQ4_9ARAC|nr:hypothetical protein TNIN_107171 [Trichonephila inaurata madagascariensis]
MDQIFSKSFSNVAVDNWGKSQEAIAKQQFLTYLSDRHVNGMLLPCGLLVDKENIFFSWGNCRWACYVRLLRNSFSGSKRKRACSGANSKENSFLDNSLNWKRTHIYFDQIQGQMDIWKLSKCYFITSSDKVFHCQIVEFDENYWNLQKSLLDRFFQTYVLPEILKKLISVFCIYLTPSLSASHVIRLAFLCPTQRLSVGFRC